MTGGAQIWDIFPVEQLHVLSHALNILGSWPCGWDVSFGSKQMCPGMEGWLLTEA